MAVENKYVNANLAAGEFADTNAKGGSKAIPVIEAFEVAAADDNGSVYRVFKIKSSALVAQLEASSDAITGGTDYDFGLYETIANGGAVVDKDLFADGLNLSSASKRTNALTAPDIADLDKQLWELLGLAKDPNKDYDLAITANTVGSAAGTILVNALMA